MLQLETLARLVVETRGTPDNAYAIAQLSDQLDLLVQYREIYADRIESAALMQTEDLEVDDNPIVSPGDGGVWVSAWVWVPMALDDDEDWEPS